MSRIITLAAVSALGLVVGGCSTQPRGGLTPANNTGVYSLHQPVVEHINFVFDLTTNGDRVPDAELDRLAAWFGSIDIGYGDRLTIDEPRGYESAGARQDVARIASRFGLLLADGAPVTEGNISPGRIRVVASRSSAHVPGCPYWSDPGIESPVRTATNYGCSINSNLAAMIADPDDLVRGRDNTGQGSATTAGRAVRLYRDRTPSGTQPLPSTTTRTGQ
ncbi:MAG TPA: CpaD family pilus assembly lipoprotein [Allosphingosinicella sp.]|nr:CpaD family pilus assembly lipoprotein [Allosphingosinicella sp.]